MSKRANGDGTEIVRHASGNWRQRISLPGGKRKDFYGKTQREVREKRDAWLTAYRAGMTTDRSHQKLSAYLDGWLKAERERLGARTAQSYDLNVRRLTPHIGHIKLSELKPAHIRECCTALLERGLGGKPLSKRSVQQCHTVLHTALEQAVREELIPRNPCDAVRPPQPERKEMKTLSLEQVQTLFETTREDRLHALWVLLALTGMRSGEAIGLKWGDIDLDGRTLAIQRTLRRITGQGLQFGPVKTHRSKRRIDLPTLVVDALRLHQDTQRWGNGPGKNLVFTNTRGSPLDPGNVWESFQRRCKRAGIPPVRTHDLRHTAASIHLRDNQHPKVVQELLGHSTIAITLNTYSHLVPSMTRNAADRMDALFGRQEATN